MQSFIRHKTAEEIALSERKKNSQKLLFRITDKTNSATRRPKCKQSRV